MIKFFRKIRQKLLSEGNTGKYLKYALGEILLVVIGILIALWINDLRQQHFLEKESQQAIINLREEIIERKNQLENTAELLQKRNDERLTYLNGDTSELSDSEKVERIDRMLFFYAKTINLPVLQQEQGPDKKIVQWPELVESMRNLAESIAYYNKGIEYLEKDVHSNQLPYIVDKGVIMDLMVSKGVLNPQEYLNPDVYNSRDFKNVVASSTLMTFSLLKGLEKILDDFEELLKIIDEKSK